MAAQLQNKDIYIPFVDDEVVSVLNANGVGSDGKVSYAEAEAVTSISTWFKGNTAITSFDELKYFTSLKSLAANAFGGCTQLKSIVLPDNITSYGEYCFRKTVINGFTLLRSDVSYGVGTWSYTQINYAITLCPNLNARIFLWGYALKFVDISSNCKNIYQFVLGYCSQLKNVVLRPTTPPAQSQNDVFTGSLKTLKLFVPSGSEDSYTTSYADKYSLTGGVYAIGGDTWAAEMETLGSSLGYTLKDGESWTDEYIDYKIFGVEPPTT